ncbi:MAG: TIGR02147 family protein [Proteobacteria bacterium]|nr:TIGR02147 family protein [Pseudomonadota bacterium]
MTHAKIDHRQFLKLELSRRIEANPRYSMRGFAKHLGLDSGYLSNVMTGKRHLSIGAAQKVVTALNLSDVEAQLIFESASDRSVPGQGIGSNQPLAQALAQKELDADTYATISDMLHYLILEATFLENFRPDPRWLARRIGVTVIEVEEAMARLIRLGLLELVNGNLRKAHRYLPTKDKTRPTPAHKASQQQILKSALYALRNSPLEERASIGMTMAIDPEKVPLAKQMITQFIDSLSQVLESGERHEVYQIGVSLFSLEKNLVR